MSTQSILPSAPPADEIGDNFSDAAPLLDENMTSPTSSTSTTAYAFSGSDLKSEFDNPKDKDTKKEEEEPKADESLFECNICLDTAKDAVVSLCGHLYCWPCLHQWMETRPLRKLCPVCKAAIGKDKVIPLYGRNSTKQQDPRNKVPPRPAGQRVEPEAQSGFPGFGFGEGGFHMSFGIGAFPFGYFASTFNMGDVPTAAPRGSAQYENEQTLSKLFLYIAFLCIAWLLLA